MTPFNANMAGIATVTSIQGTGDAAINTALANFFAGYPNGIVLYMQIIFLGGNYEGIVTGYTSNGNFPITIYKGLSIQ